MKTKTISELYNQKIVETLIDKKKLLKNIFYYFDISVNENTKIELVYIDEQNNKHSIIRTRTREKNLIDIDDLLVIAKKELICDILQSKLSETIKKYDSKLLQIKNSEGWYKYKNAAKYLIEEEIDIEKEDKTFLIDFLSLCK